MVKVRKDLTGMVFGRLKVLKQADDYIRPSNGQHEAQWWCECLCENHTKLIVRQNQLNSTKTQSCGCLKKEALHQSRKKYNVYNLDGEYGIGWTSNTNKEFYFELDRYDEIKNICWQEHRSSKNFSTLVGYDFSVGKKVKMHVFLGYNQYDHIDHNELNNLVSNLRPATHQENQCNMQKRYNNKSGFIGVSWNTQKQKWIAQIQCKGTYYNLGGYCSIEDAVIARLKAEQKYFGEFAPQKDLFKIYNINTVQNDLEREI